MVSPTLSFLAMTLSLSSESARRSERHGLGGARNAGGKLLERVAKIHRIGGELFECFLWAQAVEFDHLPFGLVDLAQTVVALEIGGEQAQNDAVGHDHVG